MRDLWYLGLNTISPVVKKRPLITTSSTDGI